MEDKTPLKVLFTWLTIVKTEVCESMSNSIFLCFAIFNFQWLLFDSFMICKLKNAFFLHVSTKKKSTLKY